LYNPSTNHSSLSEVAEFAKKIRQNNLKLLLSIHYSDTWADPGQQTPPIAWAGLTENILNDINTAPFVRLLKSGIRAVRDFNNGTKIIIHFAGLSGSAWFYSQLKNNTVDYDIIGLSYYPIWHGKSLDLLQTTMRDLHTAYQKPVMITETAYPFTLNWNDNTNNVLGLASQIIPEFPASEQGQLQFMQALIQRIKLVTDGAGFCYWGGEWVAFKGNTSTSGSPWENQALFNFNNKALPVMEAFRK
jgi:arabinogalactan endo-1,4-beta-galactosidase